MLLLVWAVDVQNVKYLYNSAINTYFLYCCIGARKYFHHTHTHTHTPKEQQPRNKSDSISGIDHGTTAAQEGYNTTELRLRSMCRIL